MRKSNAFGLAPSGYCSFGDAAVSSTAVMTRSRRGIPRLYIGTTLAGTRRLRSLRPLVLLGLFTTLVIIGAGCTSVRTAPASTPTGLSSASATPEPVTPTPDGSPSPAPAHSHMPASSPASGGDTYPIQMEDQINTIVSSAERTATLMQSPRLTDPAWRDSITTEINTWRSTYKAAQALEPPARYQAVHQRYLAALALADDAANSYASGLNHLDLGRMQDGAAKIQRAQQLMIDALAVMPGSG